MNKNDEVVKIEWIEGDPEEQIYQGAYDVVQNVGKKIIFPEGNETG